MKNRFFSILTGLVQSFFESIKVTDIFNLSEAFLVRLTSKFFGVESLFL